MSGKTINIYLYDGTNPKGIKYSYIKNSAVRAIFFSRSELNQAIQYEKLDAVGIYFLLSNDDEQDKINVYIGEAEILKDRLKQHNNDDKKDFWNKTICFISTNNELNKAHIKYLESYCYYELLKNSKIILKNNNTPTQSNLTKEDTDFALDFFNEIKTLTGVLGFPIFDIQKTPKKDLFYCKTKNIEAKARYDEDGLTILKGSNAILNHVPSVKKPMIDFKEKLISKNILIKKEDKYYFTEDVNINSPSLASSLVLGRSSNGWIDWKDEEGKTLDKRFRNI
ncbi:MAG: GIY-YIG nuclease family protein [Clostridia bacterium]